MSEIQKERQIDEKTRRHMQEEKRQSNITRMIWEGYCITCLHADIISEHGKKHDLRTYKHDILCLECRTTKCNEWNEAHPKCVSDTFFCLECYRHIPEDWRADDQKNIFRRHVQCSEKRKDFIEDLGTKGRHLIHPPPFKSFRRQK